MSRRVRPRLLPAIIVAVVLLGIAAHRVFRRSVEPPARTLSAVPEPLSLTTPTPSPDELSDLAAGANLAICVIDAARVDHMGCYGYSRNTTPNIDRFAAGAVTFEQAHSPSSWTRASFASYFTGLYPSTHGCEGLDGILDQALFTLAERFRECGFTTAGIYANDNIAAELGFDQGFDLYEHPPRLAGYPDGKTVAGASLNGAIKLWRVQTGECLKTLRSDRPYESMNITRTTGLSEIQRRTLKALGAVED